MKKIRILLAATLVTVSTAASAQKDTDSTGLPGDHFSLRGALELFKKSKTPEDFEKALNTEANAVNNLDLNGDNKIDYVKVIDRKKGKSHALIMQVPVNAKEVQDVVSIMIERTADSTARLQIIGNEVLYGEEKIMEPYDEVAEKTSARPAEFHAPANIVMVNVWYWPMVQYIYYPDYVVYVSPYRWDYYPVWWDPWAPWHWAHYYRRNHAYYYPLYYQYTTVCYVENAQYVYYQHRSNSNTVSQRYEAQRARYQAQRQATQPGRAGTVSRDANGQSRNANPGGRMSKEQTTPANTHGRTSREQTAPVPARNERPVQREQAPQRTAPPAPRSNEPEIQRNRETRPVPAPAPRQPQRQANPIPAPVPGSMPAPRANPGGGVRRGGR